MFQKYFFFCSKNTFIRDHSKLAVSKVNSFTREYMTKSSVALQYKFLTQIWQFCRFLHWFAATGSMYKYREEVCARFMLILQLFDHFKMGEDERIL